VDNLEKRYKRPIFLRKIVDKLLISFLYNSLLAHRASISIEKPGEIHLIFAASPQHLRRIFAGSPQELRIYSAKKGRRNTEDAPYLPRRLSLLYPRQMNLKKPFYLVMSAFVRFCPHLSAP
jgi:hypothetical protein